jgi:hypothetical protein
LTAARCVLSPRSPLPSSETPPAAAVLFDHLVDLVDDAEVALAQKLSVRESPQGRRDTAAKPPP